MACQAPLSMGFSRQVYWSGLPCFSPGDLSDPEIKPRFPALKADDLQTELLEVYGIGLGKYTNCGEIWVLF